MLKAIGRKTVNSAQGIVLLAAIGIFAAPADAALLELPIVPHYDRDALPVPPPSTQPRYTQRTDEAQHKSNTNDPEGHRRNTLWDRLALIWEKTTNDPVAFFTFWLAISTVGLWIVTWRSGVRQSREMRAAIKAAENTAVAAQINAEAARKSSEAVLRHGARMSFQAASALSPEMMARLSFATGCAILAGPQPLSAK